jgi:glycosyltransferase involved in cell wall biosynthesis
VGAGVRGAKPRSVTVVIAARDAAATLEAALRSALAEPAVVQCVVVDDASVDATGSTAAAISKGDPRVLVVRRQARGGPSVARNDGLARAVGSRVCFLDADDALVPGGLAALSQALSSAPLAVVALGRFRAVDESGTDVDVGSWAAGQLRGVVRREGRLIESPDGLTPEALVTRLVSPPPGAWLVDAPTARAVGGFDQRVRRSEDLELLVRLGAAGEIVAVERDVLRYRRHVAQRSAAQTRRRWGRGHAMWAMLRAAPGARATRRLSHGMVAYHLELFAVRRRATTLRVRGMALRNLAVAVALCAAGLAAAILPRRMPAPLDVAAVD